MFTDLFKESMNAQRVEPGKTDLFYTDTSLKHSGPPPEGSQNKRCTERAREFTHKLRNPRAEGNKSLKSTRAREMLKHHAIKEICGQR